MSKQRSLRMDDRFDRFIDERIASERYGTAEEVVEAGLSLLEERERELDEIRKAFDERPGTPWTTETLRAAIQEGLDSGEPKELDFERLFREICEEAEAESKGSVAS